MSTEVQPEDTSEVEELNEQTRGEITNAITYAEKLLRDLNLLTNTPPSTISANSIAIGNEIFIAIQDLLAERQIIDGDELININEEDEVHEYEEVSITFVWMFSFLRTNRHNIKLFTLQYPGVEGDGGFVADEFAHEPADYVPLSYKERAVALAVAHPKWSLKSLQSHGVSRLKHKSMLYRWKEDVKRGGTRLDKLNTIDRETYERFVEARQNLEQVNHIKIYVKYIVRKRLACENNIISSATR